jgi:hypothetical protein
MDDEIYYSQHSEPELVDMFGRMDRRYAPAECARLAKFLTERGYIVTDGDLGPGSATPSPQKLEQLIGSSCPFECQVEFEANKGFWNSFRSEPNLFGFSGTGNLVADGIYVWISGQVAGAGPFHAMAEENTQLAYARIANVESADRVVRFEYNVEDFRGDSIVPAFAELIASCRRSQAWPSLVSSTTQPDARRDRRLIRGPRPSSPCPFPPA